MRHCHGIARLLAAAMLVGGLSCAWAQGRARVSDAVAEAVSRNEPVDALLLIDDTVEARQLDSAVGPASVRARLSRSEYATFLGTQRMLMRSLKSDVMLTAADPDVEILTDYDVLPVLHVRIRSARALENLRRQGRIRAIDAIRHVQPALVESLPLIGQNTAAAAGHLGAGTSVAVLDTGVDYKRAAFGSCSAPGGSCKVAYAQDFATPDGVVDFGDFHGTNVAGIVLGVAPATKILALDVFESSGTASSNVLLNAINWCITNRATYNIAAINMSLGGGQHYAALAPSDSMGVAITTAVNAGIAVVVASGNNGWTNSISWPAAYSNVLSVGAYYDAGGSVNQVTSFSNSASFLTMVAPGSMIYAAGISMQGTSQATPHVAGAVAVLRSAYPTDTVPELINRLKLAATITDARNGIAKARLDLVEAMSVPASAYRLTVSKAGSGTGTVTSTGGGIACGGTCAANITSGDNATVTALHGPNAMFSGWTGSCVGSNVSCTMSMTAARSVTATFAPNTAEDFLAGGLLPASWTQPAGSSAAWAPFSGSFYVGSHSLKAGTVSHGQSSAVSYTGNFADGTVSFARRVSSESGQDYLRFYIDNELQGSWSGEVAWGMVSYPIASGSRVLKWAYEKNGSGSAGSDTAWIDSVNLPLAATDRKQSATDFNGDGRADVLWRHGGTGANTLWLMDSTMRRSGSGAIPSLTDVNWRVVGRGDFNNDGRADILWRHSLDGRNSVWFMDGIARVDGSGVIGSLTDRNWQVAGVGDFNGDGKADILWRHAGTGANSIWLMDGLTKLAGSGATTAISDLNWRVMGVADFNGDGKADILWRHLGNGSNTLWFMDGITKTSGSGATVALTDLKWKLVGVADFNGDGKSDILWRNTTDGRNSLWLMNGLTRQSSAALQSVTDLNFKVAGLGDFNGDGRADIFWRNGANGQNSLWFMNGSTRLSGASAMPAITDLNWKAVAPSANPH
jgi:subtilisin family serine protease